MIDQSHGLRAKKSLGQHFLVDSNVISRISELIVSHQSYPFILEIGPGTGNLTAAILQRIQNTPVIAIEKDSRALTVLADRFEGSDLTVHEGDALNFDLNQLPDGKGIVAGNLPYNVGTAIFIRSLQTGSRIQKTVFMFQAEVARRITAVPSTSAYGSLSVFAQVWGKHEIAITIPPEAFAPPPKVDSAVVVSEVSETPLIPIRDLDVKGFESFVKGAFQHRRKTMAKSLSLSGRSRVAVQEAIHSCGFPDKIRAEALSPSELAGIWNALDKHRP